jgi:hypothetical protein
MKIASRVAAIAFLLVLAGSTQSFAYEVLCQSLPVTKTVTDVITPMFTCAIPANAVAEGKSLRVTSTMHSGSQGELLESLLLNGADAAYAYVTEDGQAMGLSFIITNTGGTTEVIGGQSFYPAGTASYSGSANATIPWTSGWTLEISANASSGSVTADGDTFVVEILD